MTMKNCSLFGREYENSNFLGHSNRNQHQPKTGTKTKLEKCENLKIRGEMSQSQVETNNKEKRDDCNFQVKENNLENIGNRSFRLIFMSRKI